MPRRVISPLAAGLLSGALLLAARDVAAQRPSPAARYPDRLGGFPAAAFGEVVEAAEWMAQYDRVAWISSDMVMAEVARMSEDDRRRLGTEWFCFERDSVWHAVYGRWDEGAGRYDAVLHFVARRGRRIERSDEPVDAALATRYGRAIHVADERVPSAIRESHARFNTYVRPRADGALDVWLIPAWQPDGVIVYGAELRYGVRDDGTVADSAVIVGALRAVRPDSTARLVLDNREREVPTVGQTLFLLLYRRYFGGVSVRSRDYVSTLVRTPDGEAWLHAHRDARR